MTGSGGQGQPGRAQEVPAESPSTTPKERSECPQRLQTETECVSEAKRGQSQQEGMATMSNATERLSRTEFKACPLATSGTGVTERAKLQVAGKPMGGKNVKQRGK